MFVRLFLLIIIFLPFTSQAAIHTLYDEQVSFGIGNFEQQSRTPDMTFIDNGTNFVITADYPGSAGLKSTGNETNEEIGYIVYLTDKTDTSEVIVEYDLEVRQGTCELHWSGQADVGTVDLRPHNVAGTFTSDVSQTDTFNMINGYHDFIPAFDFNEDRDSKCTLTITSLTIDGTQILEGESEPEPEPEIITPPILEFSNVATTTCSGSSTSSVCTYDYITSTTTDENTIAIQNLNRDIMLLISFFIFIFFFLLTFFSIKTFTYERN